MRNTLKLPNSTPAPGRRELIKTVEKLQKKKLRDLDVLEELQQCWGLLDSFQLANSEYGRAVSHIRSACRFLESREHGSARYELQMLAGMLRREYAGDMEHVGG